MHVPVGFACQVCEGIDDDSRSGGPAHPVGSAPGRGGQSVFAYHLSYLLVSPARRRYPGHVCPRYQSPFGPARPFRHGGDPGELVAPRRRSLRRRRGAAIPDGAARGPDLWPGGAEPGEPDREVRAPGGDGPLPRGPVPGHAPGRHGARRRRDSRPLGHPHRTGRRPGGSAPGRTQRDHDARRGRVRESRAGLRFPDPVVRPARAPVDAALGRGAHRHHRRLPPARAPRGRPG
jgi:hypothetical protein